MIVSVPKETAPGELRTALVPDLVPKLVKAGLQVVVQAGAIGRPGEALVLDMGAPVRIVDVARLLAARESAYSIVDLAVDTNDRRPEDVARDVLAFLTSEGAHRKTEAIAVAERGWPK